MILPHSTIIVPPVRYRVAVEGIVQGVGFRPFVKRLGDRLQLRGRVFNTTDGVIVELDATARTQVDLFTAALRAEAPAAAHIESIAIAEEPGAFNHHSFSITGSEQVAGAFTLIPADLATCPDCIREMFDPADRRYLYPFINCTNCGPRYTITRAVPYDRPNTTMAPFPMCAACAAEYSDPANRRFHAEPVACPTCGPQLSMPLADVLQSLERGEIVAVKSLGGFQLACNAFSSDAVATLRARKRRGRKPFAVMMRDMAALERYCLVDDAARRTLTGVEAPIILLPMRDPHDFPPGLAPGLAEIGVMLPYTPLHHLLFSGPLNCLVMTSANMSEEPIVVDNTEAAQKLAGLADRIVSHDRAIFTRADDSVVRIFEGIPRALRRSRGYAPNAIRLAHDYPDVLAAGAELKNTFCITRGHYAVLSQHIGDLENLETLEFFEETVRNLQRVYGGEPQAIAHDLHPDYLSTQWALARPEPKIAVQHHHAHIASTMAEHGLNEQRVIGVAFDGTGWGTDGQIWGGEFLLCDYLDAERAAHLRYVPLPGGDRGSREGFRMAASYLHDAFGEECRDMNLPCWAALPRAKWDVLWQMIAKPAIRTSSSGRLFDAVAAICGVSQQSSYEGESAMLLEATALHADAAETYDIALDTAPTPWIIDPRPMLRQIAHDVLEGRGAPYIAARFHHSMSEIISQVCEALRDRTGIRKVCLSGGTFQNSVLLEATLARLRHNDFDVYIHAKVPANDGGLALGQAVIAASRLSSA